MQKFLEGIPGLVLVGVLSALTLLIGKYVGLSSTLLAIVLGFVVANIWQLPQRFSMGVCWVESYGLATAVALLGVQLNLSVLMQINPISLVVIAATILMTFMVTFLVARMLRVGSIDSCLLASGQGICGSAAVMAASKTLNAGNKSQIGLIIGVINFLGFIGVFITPWLVQQYFHGSNTTSAFLIGNTLQSMGHVVAAGFSINDEVGHGAVLIKMCRILFLIPTLLVLIFWFSRSNKKQQNKSSAQQTPKFQLNWLKLVPMFIWGFVVLIVLYNLGWIAPEVVRILSQVGDALFILAMVAIGLSIRLRDIWQQGSKLLLLGGLVFMLQIVFTWSAIKLI